MRWPWEKKIALEGPPMACPSCEFTHMEAVNQTFRVGIVAGAPLLVPSGFKLMCSKCGSLLRLTADQGLKLVREVKAEDDKASENGKAEDDTFQPDTDARQPAWVKRRQRQA